MILGGELILQGLGEKIDDSRTRFGFGAATEFDFVRKEDGEDEANIDLCLHLDESKRLSIECENPTDMPGSEDIIITFKDEQQNKLELVLNRAQAAVVLGYLVAHLDMLTAIDKLRVPAIA